MDDFPTEIASSSQSFTPITPKGVTPLSGIRFFIEVEEDPERHCLRFSYAAENEKPVTAGTLMLHPFIAFWLLEQLIAAGAEVDVERERAE